MNIRVLGGSASDKGESALVRIKSISELFLYKDFNFLETNGFKLQSKKAYYADRCYLYEDLLSSLEVLGRREARLPRKKNSTKKCVLLQI